MFGPFGSCVTVSRKFKHHVLKGGEMQTGFAKKNDVYFYHIVLVLSVTLSNSHAFIAAKLGMVSKSKVEVFIRRKRESVDRKSVV